VATHTAVNSTVEFKEHLLVNQLLDDIQVDEFGTLFPGAFPVDVSDMLG
jgi:hypothetical protein